MSKSGMYNKMVYISSRNLSIKRGIASKLLAPKLFNLLKKKLFKNFYNRDCKKNKKDLNVIKKKVGLEGQTSNINLVEVFFFSVTGYVLLQYRLFHLCYGSYPLQYLQSVFYLLLP